MSLSQHRELKEEKEPQGLEIAIGLRGHLWGLLRTSLRDNEGDVLSLVDAIMVCPDFNESDKLCIAEWFKRLGKNLWQKAQNEKIIRMADELTRELKELRELTFPGKFKKENKEE